MKIKIRPYKSWWDTNGVERLWLKLRYPDEAYLDVCEGKDSLDRAVLKILEVWHMNINYWINKFRHDILPQRKDIIHIDDYDVWNMDTTLSRIIHPMLVKLHEKKHGSPHVDDEDVPEELRSTSAPAKENEWDTDDNHHKRWDWVMEELIWTFDQLQDTSKGEDQFYHNRDNQKIEFVPSPDYPGYSQLKSSIIDPSKPAYYVDKEGLTAYHERINNGLRLLCKYFRGLWD